MFWNTNKSTITKPPKFLFSSLMQISQGLKGESAKIYVSQMISPAGAPVIFVFFVMLDSVSLCITVMSGYTYTEERRTYDCLGRSILR